MESILTSVKKLLGITEEDTSYDSDIIVFINFALSNLTQIGVGPKEGFSITDKTQTWSQFLPNEAKWNPAKTYVYFKVRLVFDPPQSSIATEAIKEAIKECEWRLEVETSRLGEIQ